MKMSLKSVAEEYFSGINSIAARLCTDLEETKMSYSDLWTKLSDEEQQAILTESIIKPEVCIKYCAAPRKDVEEESYAVKLIFDDNCSYRDEHSGPFSFRTQSQRDLSLFEKGEKKVETKVKGTNKPKSKQLALLYHDSILDSNVEDQASKESNKTLPKTGLDFLDNW